MYRYIYVYICIYLYIYIHTYIHVHAFIACFYIVRACRPTSTPSGRSAPITIIYIYICYNVITYIYIYIYTFYNIICHYYIFHLFTPPPITIAITPGLHNKFPLGRFSPGAGLLRYVFFHWQRLRFSRGWVRKDGHLLTETGYTITITNATITSVTTITITTITIITITPSGRSAPPPRGPSSS